jgi:hypothetical protein
MGSDVVDLNRLALTLYIDTMIIGARDDASIFLRRLVTSTGSTSTAPMRWMPIWPLRRP